MSKAIPKLGIGIKNMVHNATDSAVLELYFLDALYNTVSYDWYSGDCQESNIVADVISQVKNYNPSVIKCIIDSQGGDCNIGIPLYNFLKNYNAKIEVDIVGMAGSIASVLAMAASKGKLTMARNGWIVIHEAWGDGYGRSKDLREQADVIDRYTATIVDIYSQRTGKPAAEIAALIADGDYWINGVDAKAMGWCDDTYNDNPQFQITARIKTLDPHYRRIPQNLITPPEEQETELPGDTSTALESFFMDLRKGISAFVGKMQGKTVENNIGADKIPAAVANLMSEPLGVLMDEIQTEVSAEIGTAETRILAAISEKYDARIAQLETTNADLTRELQEAAGKETKDSIVKNDVKPIGFGIKA